MSIEQEDSDVQRFGVCAYFAGKPKGRKLQMDWLRSEDLKEEKIVTASMLIIAGHGIIHWFRGKTVAQTPSLICIDQPTSAVWPTLVLTFQRRRLWLAATSQKYPAHFAASPWI